MMRTTNEQIIAAYQQTGSVWRAGRLLGLAGQTVHERLVALHYPMTARIWTDEEVAEMRTLLAAGVRIGEIAQRLGRSYAGVTCKASEIGIRAVGYHRKIQRGTGFDKVSTLRHMTAVEAYAGKFTQYSRANGLSVEMFARALEIHCPDRWKAYVASRSDLPHQTCGYCEIVFIPSTKRQRYCSRKCSQDARADVSYFGGKRKTTVGLAEGVCQLCGRQGQRRLSSHHVYGKENDPDNDVLIALCSGCHNLVTMLAARTFVDDRTAWESLISLAWLRRHGAEVTASSGLVLEVVVDLESYEDPEEAVL